MTENFKIYTSTPYPLGIRREGKSIFASIVSEKSDCGVVLYSTKQGEDEPLKIPFPEHMHVGKVYSMRLEGIPAHYSQYKIYRGKELMSEEHGRSYEAFTYGKKMHNNQMQAVLYERKFDWTGDQRPEIPFSESIYYGLHVRGFTMGIGSKCRHKGTFQGVQEKLDYLQDLGITTLALLPAYEFIELEEQEIESTQKAGQLVTRRPIKNSLNYWGFKKGYYYAPKSSYAATKDAVVEFKQLVKACHKKNMELVMQFYFPEEILEPEIINILQHWASEYHVDGFMIHAGHININLIKEAPTLSDVKLIFREFQDTNPKRNETVKKRLCVYHDNTIHDFRRFLKGDEYTIDAAMYHFRKNGNSIAYMNSIADFNTFRLADMVSYDYKRNEANGENNLDGNNYNQSWNCGVEGPTKKKSVLELRERQMKNALSLILLSQGTPYLYMGDEMAFSQQGNNNPYNQDNEISWINWNCLKKNKAIYEYTKVLIAYRKKHHILCMDHYLDGSDIMGCGIPNISFHGLEAYKPVAHSNRRELGVLLCGKYARERDGKEDNTIYIACNMHWDHHSFALPKLPKNRNWKVVLKTIHEDLKVMTDTKGKMGIEVPPRTIVVLEA